MRFHLRVWTRHLVPVETVWRAHTDPTALAASLGLPSGWVEGAVSFEGDAPRETVLRVRGPLGRGLPVWPLRLTQVEPGVRYVDTSENTWFRAWSHEHLFEPTPDGCRYVDAITFAPAGPAPQLVADAVKRVFVRRHRWFARKLASDARATGISVLRARVEDGWDEPSGPA
ncbi:MAG: hypothetical protein RLZZ299_142 [Pseudomonadota bacterium]|jgi:ligand-binding SRPBCC domain-containing protein